MTPDTTITTPASAPDTSTQQSGQKTGYKRKNRKKKRMWVRGKVYIQATYNNTLISLVDSRGDVVAWSSAGHLGFKGPKKSTPYAASQVVRSLLTKIADVGLKEVDVFVKGVGSGRESAVRAFGAQSVNVLSITDMTPVPHNGCRPRRPRRV